MSGAAEDRELARRREVEVERAERPAERRRRARQVIADEPERPDRLPLELLVSPDPREPQEDEREHRVARRDRVVLERLLPRDELLAVGRREEEAAALVVSEERDRAIRGAAARAQPAEIARRDVQLVEAVRDVRVVVEVRGELRAAVARRPPQRLGIEQLPERHSRL